MAGSLIDPTASSAQDYGDEAHYVISGSHTRNDGKIVRAVTTIDPTTGLPALPGAGGAGGGPVTIDDGSDVAQGSTADLDTANTTIGLLKALKGALTGTVATSVADGQNAALGTTSDASSASTLVGLLKNLKAALAGKLATTVADGDNATIGTTTDASSTLTLVGLLKAIKASVAGIIAVKIDQTTPGTTNAVAVTTLPAAPSGTNTIGGVFAIPSATHGAAYAACPAATATTVKASAGVLKALWISGTGVLGTVAIADGSTTYFTAEVPASLSTLALPLPPEGVAHATSIVVTTTGVGVTAAAVYA